MNFLSCDMIVSNNLFRHTLEAENDEHQRYLLAYKFDDNNYGCSLYMIYLIRFHLYRCKKNGYGLIRSLKILVNLQNRTKRHLFENSYSMVGS